MTRSGDGLHRDETITAWMIVRDEEANLPDCLASLDGLADRIVVVDTGSVDGTVALATDAGAEVHHVAWDDDFAAARNAALDLCDGDWLLWIDADERLQPTDREVVLATLRGDRVVAGRVALRRRVGYTPCWEVRVFRPHAAIRFEGSIHGDISGAVERLVAAGEGTIVDLPLRIDHFGYEGDQSHRHARNLPMLRARLEREPDHVFCWIHLGQTLDALGEAEEAEASFERAVEIVRSDPSPIPQAWVAYDALVRYRLVRGDDVSGLLAEGVAHFAAQPMYHVTCAQVYLMAGDPGAAIAHLEEIVTVDLAGYVGIGSGLPEDLFGANAWVALAQCRWKCGDVPGAADAFDQAYRLAPSIELKGALTVARAQADHG